MTNDLVISGTRSLNQLECSKPNYEQIASESFCWLYIYIYVTGRHYASHQFQPMFQDLRFPPKEQNN